jgi:hypothetical protein
VQHYDRPHPRNAPKWSYKGQPGAVYDTEVEAGGATAEEYVTETEEYTEVRRGFRPLLKKVKTIP